VATLTFNQTFELMIGPLGRPTAFDSDELARGERIHFCRELCPKQRRDGVDRFAERAHMLDSRREVTVCGEHVCGVEFVLLGHDHHVDRQHDIDRFFDHDGGLMVLRQLHEVLKDRAVDPRGETRKVGQKLPGDCIGGSPLFEPAEVRADTRVSFELREEPTLTRIERYVSALGYTADVIPRFHPVAAADQLG